MKSLLLGIFFSFSTVATACPELRGDYAVCKAKKGTIPFIYSSSITQIDENGITKFQLISKDEGGIDDEMIVADGNVYREQTVIPGYDRPEIITSSSYCTADQLISTKTFSVPGLQRDYTVVRKFQKKGRSLVINWKDDVRGYETSDVIVCD